MDVLDAEVLATLGNDLCRPAVIVEALRLAQEELSPRGQDRTREELEAELLSVRREETRLAESIGGGGLLEALIARLTERQARRTAIESELRRRAAAPPRVTPAAQDAALRAKLADWRGLLERSTVTEGREALRTLLIGPLVFTPVVEAHRCGYAFSGTILLDRLLAGVVELPTKMASPAGFEPAFWP